MSLYGYKKKGKPANWTGVSFSCKIPAKVLAEGLPPRPVPTDKAGIARERKVQRDILKEYLAMGLKAIMIGGRCELVHGYVVPGSEAEKILSELGRAGQNRRTDGKQVAGRLPARPPIKHKPIRHRAQRHQAGDRAYRAAARAFVEAAVERGETCPVVAAIDELREGRKYGHPISGRLVAVHHIRGRDKAGRLLNDQRFWMAVSTQGHRWIHSHIAEARTHGWYAQPGDWNRTDDL